MQHIPPVPRFEIRHGDCLEVLPTLPLASVDVILTDPPYSSGARGDLNKPPSQKYVQSGAKRQLVDFAGDGKQPFANLLWSIAWMRQCAPLLKPQGYMLVFSDWRTLPMTSTALQCAGFDWRGVAVWDKTLASRPPNKASFRHQCEYICWAMLPGAIGRGEWGRGPFPGCFKERSPIDKKHICQKPVSMLKDLLACCPPAGSVADPFAGSGATGKACQELGLDFLGIELVTHWAEYAARAA